MCCEGMCCCIACCCTDTSDSCRKMIGREKATKLCYIFIVVVFTVPAILVMFLIHNWKDFETYFWWMSCPSSSSGSQLQCIGSSAVFRISISFLALFGVMFLFMLCRCRPSMFINEGFFCLKYFCVLILFVGLLFARNESFETYADASQYISIGFMVLQVIILVDLFYLAGIKLVARYDEGQTCCAPFLVILSILFYAGAIGLVVAGYVRFGSTDECGSTLWLNIVTSLILVVLPMLQLCNFNKQNSLLTTALVCLFISYLSFISQYSYCNNPDPAVTRVSLGSIATDVAISTFFFFLTMYGSIMGGSGQVKISEENNLNAAMGVAPTKEEDENDRKEKEKEANRPVKQDSEDRLEDPQADAVALGKYTDTCDWVKWHLYMCIASIYIAMLVTNWNSASPITSQLVSSNFGFWVRVAMSWFTTLVYVWTLLAPRVFPDRDFSVS